MVSHVDHTEHDVDVLVTECGLADLRGMAPRERARAIIRHCVHPSYREALQDYFDRACERGGQTPHLLEEAFSWHQRFSETDSMRLSKAEVRKGRLKRRGPVHYRREAWCQFHVLSSPGRRPSGFLGRGHTRASRRTGRARG